MFKMNIEHVYSKLLVIDAVSLYLLTITVFKEAQWTNFYILKFSLKQ